MTNEEIERRKQEIYDRAIALNNGSVIGCGEFYTEQDKLDLAELRLRGMINSSLTYGEGYNIFDDKNNVWGKYGLEYGYEIGYTRAYEIWVEQRDFFKKYAKVTAGVHTDYEGCTYNSVEWVC